jgi:hypothetical protein
MPRLMLRAIDCEFSENLQPFDMDPGSMARGDELLKNTGLVRLFSVIPGLTRNPCSSERDCGRMSRASARDLFRAACLRGVPRKTRRKRYDVVLDVK